MKRPLLIVFGLICGMVLSCSEKKQPAPAEILDSVKSVREYADSFVGLEVEKAKRKLSPAPILEEEWVDDDIIDGKAISVEYDQYELLLMCHDGFVLSATISVTSN